VGFLLHMSKVCGSGDLKYRRLWLFFNSDTEMPLRGGPRPEPGPRGGASWTHQSLAHPSTEEQDHPHACLNGYIYLSYTAFDEQTGEEVERIEALPCHRCAEEVR
jgi:hypothetical protein